MTTYDKAGHILQTVVQDQASVWGDSKYMVGPTLLQPTSFDSFGHAIRTNVAIDYGSSTAEISQASKYDNRGRLVNVFNFGLGYSSPATQSIGTITITGAEQQSGNTYDSGSVSVTINGKTATVSYGSTSTPPEHRQRPAISDRDSRFELPDGRVGLEPRGSHQQFHGIEYGLDDQRIGRQQ